MKDQPKTKILLVEDSRFFQAVVQSTLKKALNVEIITVASFAEARSTIKLYNDKFDFALVDIVLPDSDKGEVVRYVLEKQIPCIVFTSVFSETFRNEILSLPIIDYLVKDSPSCIELLVNLLVGLVKNKGVKAMVVDDSRACRLRIARLLERRQFDVTQVETPTTAIELLQQNDGFRLLVTDFEMPEMNGVELVKEIRKSHNAHKLAILGLSSSTSATLSAQFVKYGANDFLEKTFIEEEFFCRVQQNMSMLYLIDDLQKTAVTDYLTGMYNRAYFFDVGSKIYSDQDTSKTAVTAMLDLDHFKAVNDNFGHDIGDYVLKSVATIIQKEIALYGVAARIGGEEFGIVISEIRYDDMVKFFENLCQKIANKKITYNGQHIPVTCSIGVATGCDGLEGALSVADGALYRAKNGGRNRVEFS